MSTISGIYPALVTPFDEYGKLDTNRAQILVEKLQKNGVSGFYVGGSTGESYLLSVDERKKMLEAVVEACDPKLDVIANIGMLATEHSIELAKHAEKLNVKAISSVPPFYFPFNMDEYFQYYCDLADSVDVPVLVYNSPAMSGIQFSMDDLEQLLSNEKIMGLKHTSYDLFQLQRLIQRYPEKTMFVGHDELLLSALGIGAKAAIGSTFNIMPEKYIMLFDLYKKNKKEEAITVQGEVNAIIEVLCKVGIFKGIKEVLTLQGMDCGVCRKPFQPLTETQKALVKETAEKYRII